MRNRTTRRQQKKIVGVIKMPEGTSMQKLEESKEQLNKITKGTNQVIILMVGDVEFIPIGSPKSSRVMVNAKRILCGH